MDHYRILQINESASREDVRAAYLRLVQENHPDRLGGAESQPSLRSSKETFKRIQTAYEVLYDRERRAEYDRLRLPPLVHPATAHAPYGRRASSQLLRRRARKPSIVKRLLVLSLSLLLFVLLVISMRFLILLPGTTRTELVPIRRSPPPATAQGHQRSRGDNSNQSKTLPTPQSPRSELSPLPAETAVAAVASEMATAQASIQEPPLAHSFAAEVFSLTELLQPRDVVYATAFADGVKLDSPAFYSQGNPPRLPTTSAAGPFPVESAIHHDSMTRSNGRPKPSPRPRIKPPRRYGVGARPDHPSMIHPTSRNQYLHQPPGPSTATSRRYLSSQLASDRQATGLQSRSWTTSPNDVRGSTEQPSHFSSALSDSSSIWGTAPNAFARTTESSLAPAQSTQWSTAPRVFNESPDDVFQPGLTRPFGRTPASSGLTRFPSLSPDAAGDARDRFPGAGSRGRFPSP